MSAEIKVDCYDGDDCESHRPYWSIHAEGDQDECNGSEDVILKLKQFPAGTKIYVDIPVCPECDRDREKCECGFDWRTWEIDRYS